VTRTILISGNRGQLGRALARACVDRGIDHEGRDLETLDISDPRDVDEWIVSQRPLAVVNCAADTAVDDCETHHERAMAVNGQAVGYLAAACNAVDATLVQISTDYVFRGDGDRPYVETDTPDPVSAYGRSKLLGEQMAATAGQSLVVRTAWLFGHGGRNFVEAIRSQIETGAASLRVVADQRGSPTYCDDLAAAILDLIDRRARGIVHAVNTGTTTWHGFAVEIARLLDRHVTVEAISTDRSARPAPRPANSVLDTSRLEGLLCRSMPTWQDALARYLAAG
jgi:dTDP-4-dehydrorhamnose reductase